MEGFRWHQMGNSLKRKRRPCPAVVGAATGAGLSPSREAGLLFRGRLAHGRLGSPCRPGKCVPLTTSRPFSLRCRGLSLSFP